MQLNRSGKTVDWTLIILINFMWATQVPVIRLIGDSLGPVAVAFVPLIVSTLIFLPVLWMENRKRNVPMKWKWADMKNFILPGLIGIFVMQYAYTLGSRYTLAANAGIITLTIPVIVAVFASILLKEKFNIIRIISFVLAIAGVLMTSVSDITGADFIHGQYLGGNLIFLFACCCCGFYNTYCKVLVNKKYTELEILVYSSIVASIAAIPVLIWVEPFHYSEFIHSGTRALLGILELSVVVYGVSMLLFFYVLKRMDVTQAVLGNYLLPFFIAIMGVLLLNEKITWLMFAGGITIMISTLMVTVYENRLLAFFNHSKNIQPDSKPDSTRLKKITDENNERKGISA
jgi:drug/metabolite transporter (DMT)-like permease